MCEQAISVPEGLKTGPIFVDGVKMPDTGDTGPALNISPAASGVQHCEVAGRRPRRYLTSRHIGYFGPP
jgi:hypothetical protein